MVNWVMGLIREPLEYSCSGLMGCEFNSTHQLNHVHLDLGIPNWPILFKSLECCILAKGTAGFCIKVKEREKRIVADDFPKYRRDTD
jgi:hypothetical protein